MTIVIAKKLRKVLLAASEGLYVSALESIGQRERVQLVFGPYAMRLSGSVLLAMMAEIQSWANDLY